jgi:tetratricopeptide (TPR) repeat protein
MGRLLPALPAGPRRQQHELELLTALGSALTATKGWSATDVSETFARARALAEKLDRPDYLIPLLTGQWAYHLVRAEHRLALPLAEQLEKIGATRNNAVAQLLSWNAQGIIRFLLGEFATARALLERCLSFADPTYRNIGLSFDPYALSLTWLALSLAYLGYIDQARLRIDEALSECHRLKHPHTLAHAHVFADWLNWLTGLPVVHSEEVVALSAEHGFPHYLGWGLAYRGRSLIVRGEAQ